ncbi:hypothetical protein BCR43DRAFT_509032 [Syncephalastrum racemosum]|uniref:HAD-like domain-containing protein n=1 Tax=Syncephalastrum racemosum TaxID=13706 RepID=A0A1X2H0G3_SYNRA|nr:hypothetical protein BCR43DRAFT_509032 [Syncephalastrum racemosum]
MVLKTPSEEIKLRAHLVLASGDIRGVADLINHVGHQSDYGCRICLIQTSDAISPQGKGRGRYYKGERTAVIPLRQAEAFIAGDTIHGIKYPCMFASLPSFHGATFFGLDELHSIAQNIGSHIWKMICDDFGVPSDNPFVLTKADRGRIGLALSASLATLPLGLDGAVNDLFNKPKSARGVDWIDFLLYVVPTLVFEHLKHKGISQNALKAIIKLVTGCALATEWDISEFEVTEMENARPMERAIGLIKRHIKSRKAPGKNVGEVVFKMAASCYFERSLSMTRGENSKPREDVFYVGDDENDPEIWNLIPKQGSSSALSILLKGSKFHP